MKEIGKMINMKEKEFIMVVMVIDMKEILEIIGKKKEFIIIIMVIDMKEIGKMKKEKEKEYFIFTAVIKE